MDTIYNASYTLNQDGTPVCSGQFVSETQFLTALHCFTPGSTYSISMDVGDDGTYDHTIVELELTNVRSAADLAIFSFDPDKYQISPYFVDVATVEWGSKMAWGDELLVASFPAALYLTAVPGTYIGWAEAHTGSLSTSPQNNVNAILMPGSSGGGLYRWNEALGYLLVGIMLNIVDSQPSIATFALPENIIDIMQGAKEEFVDDRG